MHVFVDTGPEAIAGSTRLKAGTAQKLVLNGFSTALMIRLGKTYSNLMVDVSHHNAKLRGRVLVILEEATGAPTDDCAQALAATDGEVKPAILCLLAGVKPAAASSGARPERGAGPRGARRPRHRQSLRTPPPAPRCLWSSDPAPPAMHRDRRRSRSPHPHSRGGT